MATGAKDPGAFKTIGELSDELGVAQHILRYWETRFPQLKPLQRAGNRRYYRPEDVALLRGIRFLLYNDGYTIRGVQKILREHGPRFVMDYRRMAEDDEQEGAIPTPHEIPDIAAEAAKAGSAPPRQVAADGLDAKRLNALLDELEACRRVLAEARE